MLNKILIFDFDGVISDSLVMQIDTVNSFAEKYNYQKIKSPNQYRRYTMQEIIEKIKIPKDKSEEIAQLIKKTSANNYSKVRLFPGIKNVLVDLAKNYNLYILSSNGKKAINIFLKKEKMTNVFKDVYSTNGLFDKHIVLDQIISKYKFDKNNIAYIGDECRDIEAAKKSKIKTIAVCWGYDSGKKLKSLKPDMVCSKIEKLTRVDKLFI